MRTAACILFMVVVAPWLVLAQQDAGSAAYMTDAYKQQLLTYLSRRQIQRRQAAASAVAQAETGSWTNIGPQRSNYNYPSVYSQGPIEAGRVTNIIQVINAVSRQDPDSLNRVYVGFAGGGIWRTENFFDKTPTWKALADYAGLPTTSVGSFALGSNSSIIYLGLGDYWSPRATLGGVVCTSKNRGDTWSADDCKILPGQLSITDLKVIPGAGVDGADVVLVATRRLPNALNTPVINAGIFRSNDSGATFAQVVDSGACYSLAKSSLGWLAACVNGKTLASVAAKLQLSTDNGTTWGPEDEPFTVQPGPSSDRTVLAVSKPGDAIVYAFVASSDFSKFIDLYRSDNGGKDWNALNFQKAPINNVPNTKCCPERGQRKLFAGADTLGAEAWSLSQSTYNQMLAVDPNDSNVIYIGANLFTAKSIDGGSSWTITTWWTDSLTNPEYTAPYPPIPYAHADHHTATFLVQPNSGDVAQYVLVFGTDGGIFTSLDGKGGNLDNGAKNTNITTHMVDVMIGANKYPNLVLAGLQDNGVRARVGSTTVFNSILGGDGTGVAASQSAEASNGCMLIQSNWAGCPFRFFLADVNSQTTFQQQLGNPEKLCNYTTAPTEAANNVINETVWTPNRGTPFGVPPASADPTGQVFFVKYARAIFKTEDCGTSWLLWAQPGNAGLPDATLQGADRLEEPCLDTFGGCADTGKALFGGSQSSEGQYTIGISPKTIDHVAVTLYWRQSKKHKVKNQLESIAITTDGGGNWVLSKFPVHNWHKFQHNRATSPAWTADGSTLYLGNLGDPTGDKNQPATRIIKSNDPTTDSPTWVNVTAKGLPDLPVMRVLTHPTDITKLYVANWLGVYQSTDSGATFTRVGDMSGPDSVLLPLVQVADINIVTGSGGSLVLRAGSRGRSVWEYPL